MAEEPVAQPPGGAAPTATADGTMMHVKVYSPFHVYFDAPAESVTGENDTGVFDILKQHKNFLTLLKPGNIIVRTGGGKEEKVEITSGVMHVKADEVIVFLDV